MIHTRVVCHHSSLNVLHCNMAIQKKLFVYDGGESNRNVHSGIWATVFGATGSIGRFVGSKLGYIGSNLIFPYTTKYKEHHSDDIKELKLCAATGKSWLYPDMNFKDQAMIEKMIGDSNVVINLLGPRKYVKRREDFEFINIEAAERIAAACKKKGVHRLIHFSAAGAHEDSPSLDFQTKAIAEKRVLEIFPNATIFRPCPIYCENDFFVTNIERQNNFFFNKFCIVTDDCTAKKQPVSALDVATCILNALKLEETKGRTYELGGPHALTYLEVYEILFNYLRLKPTLAYVDPKILKAIAKHIYNWEFLSIDMINKRIVDEIVKPSDRVGTCADLYVEPVSFRMGIQPIFRDRVAMMTGRDEDYQS